MKLVLLAMLTFSITAFAGRGEVLVDPGDLNDKDHSQLHACLAGCGLGNVGQEACERGCWKLFGSVESRAKFAKSCPHLVGKALGECAFKVGRGPDRTQSAELQPSSAGAAR